MEIFWFERNLSVPDGFASRANDLEQHGFTGTMYPYGIFMKDYFTRIARNINPESNFKYIVAIRPYVISAQYLSMICSSVDEISSNRVFINFLTGRIHGRENYFGGVLSDINDTSSNIERSNFMLEYAKEFERIGRKNFYISTTNNKVFDFCQENNLPMIISYGLYQNSNLDNHKVLIFLSPIIRDTAEELKNMKDKDIFTKQEFFDFLDRCKEKSVHGLLIEENIANSEYDRIKTYLKEYTTQRMNNVIS